MKICISIVLLMIKIFLYFDEINASGFEGASSSSQRAREDPLLLVQRDPVDGPRHKSVYIMGQEVQLWLDRSRKHVLKAWYSPNCYIPQSDYYITHDFLIRVFIVDGVKLVAYISKDNRLIGVRAPQLLCK
ncbi:uncharacterized protein LOC117170039 [Belonocnema kinseyi]|uniref:uncharacterized protein LOC117170039 n=1 Tax=Belonocnema kinseyi TaxID=2817044 RepID=UPI00143DECA9|nr:uncharacterized protein LOC117170039 [Belonocnema kinseyi]